MKNKTIFSKKWPSSGSLDAHLAKKLIMKSPERFLTMKSWLHSPMVLVFVLDYKKMGFTPFSLGHLTIQWKVKK